MNKYIHTLNILALISISSAVNAQKIPDIQEISKIAPANIRVDGKNLEWNDTFQAKNKRTLLSYTLCNDANNLYLAIQADDATTVSKIMAGGISFAVNIEGKKKDKEVPVITYPVVKRAAGGRGGRMGLMRGMGGQGGRGQGQTSAQRDSALAATFKTQLAAVKEIKLEGFKQVTDSTISIYNEYGIKTFASVSDKNVFFYELAIPLKQLGISAADAKELAYNIKLNGLQIPGFEGGGFGGGGGGGGRSGGFGGGGGGGNRGGGGRSGGGGGIDMESLMSPTDFWGKYTLAK